MACVQQVRTSQVKLLWTDWANVDAVFFDATSTVSRLANITRQVQIIQFQFIYAVSRFLPIHNSSNSYYN